MGQHLAHSRCYLLPIPLFLWSLLPLCFCSYYRFHLSKAFMAHFAPVIRVLAHIMSSAMFFVFFAIPVPSTVPFQPQRPCLCASDTSSMFPAQHLLAGCSLLRMSLPTVVHGCSRLHSSLFPSSQWPSPTVLFTMASFLLYIYLTLGSFS